MFKRDRQPELMDDPNLPDQDHRHALEGLSRLNRLSLVAGAMYRRIRRFAQQNGRPLRVLDVASGAGDLPIQWARRAKRDRLAVDITTLDISEVAAAEQEVRAQRAGVEIRAAVRDCLREPLPSGFDVVTCSLFMHHLADADVVQLLRSMDAAAARAVVVCDLERSGTNLALVGVASRLVTRSPVVHTDAKLSVRAAFTRKEFRALAEQALMRPVVVERSFPCRFIAVVAESSIPVTVPAFAC